MLHITSLMVGHFNRGEVNYKNTKYNIESRAADSNYLQVTAHAAAENTATFRFDDDVDVHTEKRVNYRVRMWFYCLLQCKKIVHL